MCDVTIGNRVCGVEAEGWRIRHTFTLSMALSVSSHGVKLNGLTSGHPAPRAPRRSCPHRPAAAAAVGARVGSAGVSVANGTGVNRWITSSRSASDMLTVRVVVGLWKMSGGGWWA